MRRSSFQCRQVGAFLTLAMLAVAPLAAVDFTVNWTVDLGDANPGDGSCSIEAGFKLCTLRAAIQEANALVGPDKISLPSGRYTLTIPGSGEDSAARGDLDVTGGGLAILGEGADRTIVDAAGTDRVFHVFGISAEQV